MLRSELMDIWIAGVAAVDPERSVVRRAPEIATDRYERVIVIAVGKAAAGMAAGLAAKLGREPDDGVIIVPHGTTPVAALPVIEAGHPLPDEGSVTAGEHALSLARSAGADDLVVCLVSGGASALMAAPRVGLDCLREVNEALIESGAPIAEVNAIRCALSMVKGGRLAEAAHAATLRTLLISDVVGDDPAVIGSGPTVPGADTDPLAVAARYGIELPHKAMEALTVRPRLPPPHRRHETVVVASARDAARGATEAAVRAGIRSHIVTTTLTGDTVVAAIAAIDRRAGEDVAISAGETTVRVEGAGRGGRNQHAALAAAIQIANTDAVFLAAGTDGRDGPTDAAGAIVDGGTISRGRAAGLDAGEHLAAFDGYPYLEATGDLIRTGPTGTNVGDLWLVSSA